MLVSDDDALGNTKTPMYVVTAAMSVFGRRRRTASLVFFYLSVRNCVRVDDKSLPVSSSSRPCAGWAVKSGGINFR